MWDKPTRLSIFCAVYEILFWGSQIYEDALNIKPRYYEKNDWQFVFENLKLDQSLDIDKIHSTVKLFYKNNPKYTELLTSYLITWNKTYVIVKACLLTFLLEIDSNNITFTKANPKQDRELVTKYIRLSEDYIGGQNVALVHAVLSKIILDKSS